jgi:Protein of unknown function (DUF1592)/Protein of unknown function (DUF1588)/Protein of unknown function (DUF1587)/Protein of unknown function (DUF1585)/Protein of unknown function (DUF1595)/Planctomycete cytochrome C
MYRTARAWHLIFVIVLERMPHPVVRRNGILSLAALGILGLAAGSRIVSAEPKASQAEFDQTVRPFITKNCYACHNEKVRTADLNLGEFKTAASMVADPETWEKVTHRLQDGTMPPKGFPKPPAADVTKITAWIHEELAKAEQAAKPDPGRVTARRLNRAEYNNTLRDLLGIDFRPADDFPQDDSGYGFDNIGDVLSLSPVLLEKYLKAAESAVNLALNGPEKLKPMLLRAQPPGREFKLLSEPLKDYDETGLSLPNALHTTLRFPADGEYTIRVAIEGRRPIGSEPAQIAVWLDGKQIQLLNLDGPADFGGIDLFGSQAEFKAHIPAGDHWVAASVYRIYEGLPASYGGPNPSKKPAPPPPNVMRFVKPPPGATEEQIAELKKKAEERIAKNKVPANRVWVHFVEALGPYNAPTGPSPEVHKQIFTCGHLNGSHQPACARRILTSFANRAFRRPVTATDIQPFLGLVTEGRRKGASFNEALGVGMQAILVSPDFLFRIERYEPVRAQAPIQTVSAKPEQSAVSPDIRSLDQHSLASRLSYFLWSSMPDDELLRAADHKLLRKPEVLQAQVQRMLKDPKARALVENFAGQWLELRRLESMTPDREKFPEYDDYLRMSMRQETEKFFENLVRNDLSILDLLDAKYTFVNEKLAAFYGIPGVKGAEFRKVDLTGTPRGGILTQASVLMVSSYATRTSPVLRGKWILENILNAPVPPPPPNVPALDEAKIGTAGTMRQQMEEHRANPVCASCHSKMDPLGLAFENFSAIGQWRTQDGNFPIESAGALPDGRKFNGPDELRAILRQDSSAFAECVTDKMLTYALGRGLERYDKRTVREIARRVSANDYKFSSLVLEVINSLPFQKARGERNKT